ncbi:PAS domain S-box protein [Candidatus Gracilibacteria bacterium]|nr:PAS domain S-box protein [Candidatus Gracilibacteria bacterium]
MERILKRQISKHLSFLSSVELKKFQPFFDAVLSMYQSFEEDRKMIERSLEISSQEMLENNEKLFSQSKELQDIFKDMLLLIEELDNDLHFKASDMKIKDLSQYLGNLISEVQNKRLEVMQQKDSLSAIIDNIAEGIMVVGDDYKVQVFNKMSEKLTGIKESEVIGKLYDENFFFYSEKTKKCFRDFIISSILESKVEFLYEGIVIQDIKGKYIPISLIVSPMGEKKGAVVVFRDASQERELEHLKDEFVSIASHELRTPMTVINGYSAMILEEKIGTLNAAQKKCISRIKSNVEHLISLINDMLNISRLEAGKMQIDLEEISLNDFFQEIHGEFSYMFQEKNIHLHVEKNTFTCVTDKTKLHQILVNLLGNAYKFTKPEGEVTLYARKDEGSIEISIQDTGEGINSKDIELLFKKFSQVNSYLHNKAEGTGLGLSICKMLVELLGGKIFVESEYKKGSRFYFTIPCKNPVKP